jgi:hypothetical protein
VGDRGRQAAKIAQRQHGHITRAQLLALGFSSRAIGRAIARGELIRVHAGVYAWGYRRVEPVALAMAAVLACGEGAVLSHDSAAALWGLRRWPPVPEVTAREHVRRPKVHAHRSTTLKRADIRVELGVPTVTAARAIFEIAPRLNDRQLTRAVQNARRAGHIEPTALHTLLTRCPRLQQLVDPAQNPTRSTLEDLLLPWIHAHGLPVPQINTYLNGYEVDAYFPAHDLILELDSWEYHHPRDSFQSDRERDAHHLAHGTPTIRLTPERLTGHEAARLQHTLSVRR